jgi:hypothetical protein
MDNCLQCIIVEYRKKGAFLGIKMASNSYEEGIALGIKYLISPN